MDTTFNSFRALFQFAEGTVEEEGGRIPKLNLVRINVRSLQKHWDDLNVYLFGNLYILDIIMLTEANVDDKSSALFKIPGFFSLALRRNERRGGGILVFISDMCLANRLDIAFKFAEVLVMEMHKCDIPFIICAVYRSPNMNMNYFYDELTELLNRFYNNKYLILAGEFIIDVLDSRKTGVDDYLDILSEYGMENSITDYTREESLGYRITRTFIDHNLVRASNLKIISAAIEHKVEDRNFVTIKVLREEPVTGNTISTQSILIDNNKVDELIHDFDWTVLLSLDHLSLYKLIDIFRDIYKIASRVVKLKQRKALDV